MNEGLFAEIEARMRVARAFEAWRARGPWRWLPARVRPALFGHLFVDGEVRRLHG